ncbi:MAG: methyltransferase domain-containing protein [Clostridia bacterium]|nr:methyltransferase domain-containing protein [Clostridia bacterium]
MDRLFNNAVGIAHGIAGKALKNGCTAVDATAGNGHDTVFLAKLVGTEGRVYAFDIQWTAVKNTEERLLKEDLLRRVSLIHDGHEKMKQYISEKVDLVMFNLGYLPGSDHSCKTNPETTIAAMEQAMDLLKTGGLIIMVIYIGHPGGKLEGMEIEKKLRALPQNQWDVVLSRFLNRKNDPPYTAVLQKR